METKQSGFFKSKKGFTVVQNDIAKDPNISMKAKGLYLVIQAHITNNDDADKYRKDDFKKMTKEGDKAFDSAWKELKENGYIKVHNYPNGQGNKFTVELELLDIPEPGPHTFYYNKDGIVTSTNVDHRLKCSQVREELRGYQNGVGANGVGANGVPASGVGADGIAANGVSANGGYKETKNNSKELNNNYLSLTHQSIREGERKESSAIVVTTFELLVQGDIEEAEIEAADGINYEIATEPEFMKKVVMTLVDWNELKRGCIGDEQHMQVYIQIVECLTQMATTLKPAVYKNSQVTYKHIIDRMNIYIAKNQKVKGAMFIWALNLSKLVKQALSHTKVSNVRSYIKSMIWDHLETEQVRYAAMNATYIS